MFTRVKTGVYTDTFFKLFLGFALQIMRLFYLVIIMVIHVWFSESRQNNNYFSVEQTEEPVLSTG